VIVMKKSMPCKGSFVQGGGGEKEAGLMKTQKGGDLRGKPSKNGGKMSGTYGGK
jgi:hypothetical protein